ncbi:hypothetical protein AIOL_004155 [Candidatus Rhodobacter oscarellae]|uniref:Uncharacterized protein n=1 Tax=Candidatus Rhodobacter oscarellae TaxID=1675527 RepID=A0A0J9EBW4_9RHOB|nr:hypothetical protein AIOL_004155 [Candidatus Rhodobacter lobularis]
MAFGNIAQRLSAQYGEQPSGEIRGVLGKGRSARTRAAPALGRGKLRDMLMRRVTT